MNHQNGSAFLHDGALYYSPNCSRNVQVPPTEIHGYRFHARTAHLEQFLQPQWWTDAYGFLSFLVLKPYFDGAALKCLHRFMDSIVRDDEKGKFGLCDERLSQWKFVEDCIIASVAHLSKEYHHFLFPSLYPAPPSKLGFVSWFTSERTARINIAKSRDWFLIWLARLSFVVACIEGALGEADIPYWIDFLVSKHNIPQDWLSGINNSFVVDFSPFCARVGLFLNPFSPIDHQPPASWFLSMNVPIWYRLDLEALQETKQKAIFKNLQPPPELIQQATTFMTTSPRVTVIPYSSHNLVMDSQPTQHLASEQASASDNDYLARQQAYLNTKPWEAFFTARAERNKQTELNETLQARQTRLNRERNPPIQTADVYVWEWSEKEEIKLVRERVGNRERADTLRLHKGEESHYDSFANEWDCCEYFVQKQIQVKSSGDFCDTDYDDDDDDFAGDYQATVNADYVAQQALKPLPDCPPPPLIAASDVELNLSNISGLVDVISYISLFYGFVRPLPLPLGGQVSNEDWMEAMKVIGLNVQLVEQPEGLGQPIVEFIHNLAGSSGPTPDEFDIHLGNRNAFDRKHLRSLIRKEGKLFFVFYQFQGPWIAVTCAADAASVYRLITNQKVHSPKTLALLLVKHGIRFHTFDAFKDEPISTISLSSVRTKVPFRLKDYRFKPSDYEAYIVERAKLLSSPRGRAALLQGGIVGRIAKEHLGENVVLEISSTVANCGLGLRIRNTMGTLWDDQLSETEIDVICGLHHCYTGMFSLHIYYMSFIFVR